MFDFIADEIDYSDEKQREYLQRKVNSTLSLMLSTEKYTIEMLEKILFLSQSWIQPLIDQTLNLDCLTIFSDLKNAFAYVQENQEADVERPCSKLEAYWEMCNIIGAIFGENDNRYSFQKRSLLYCRTNVFLKLRKKTIVARQS